MPPWTLIEPCAGSAALSFSYLGATRSVLPYQGSKWRHRHHLQELIAAAGFEGKPSQIYLTDPGPWGRVLGELTRLEALQALITHLEAMAKQDPREVYDRVQGRVAPSSSTLYAAEYLFLQRLSFSGKAVGDVGGVWRSPGFNTSSAYGLAATERFGRVQPMMPSLIQTLRGYTTSLDFEIPVRAHRARAHGPARPLTKHTLVYLDPPYAGTTKYPNGSMQPHEVLLLARSWHEAGATVIVSETTGLELPGWRRERLHVGKERGPFRGKHNEWTTISPRANTGE